MLAANDRDSQDFERELESIRKEMGIRLRETARRVRNRVMETLVKYADETSPADHEKRDFHQ